jgi:predicted nucleic acid-binding protein
VERQTLKVLDALDANVILKWFLKEEDSNKALKLKSEIIEGELLVILPDLILYEISNALRYKKGYTPELVGEAIDALLDLDLDIVVPTKDLIRESAIISYERNISIYDAVYVALAKETAYELITADKILYDKLKDFGFVKLL